MKRSTLAAGIAAALLLSLTACGSDDGDSSEPAGTDASAAPGDTTAPGDTSAPDDTGGSGGNPLGSDECKAIYGQLITAMASAMVPGEEVDFEKVFGEAKANVPEDLQDDVDVLAEAVGGFAQEIKDNPNDPAVMQQAIAAMSTPEVQAASTAVNEYFDETCPQG